jgi:NAD(P)-dependent dehydrogenase (short-subunit alcohol dehydrogenase family)
MDFSTSLQGRVALVTGAGAGIGRAAALCLAQAGARLAVLGRTAKTTRETAAQINRQSGEAIALTAEIQDAAAMSAAVDQIAKKWGRLDIVFANAGINGVWAPIEKLRADDWSKTLDVNLIGTFLTIQRAVPLLKKNGGSVIINSSVNGNTIFSNIGATAYACSKAGQVAMAKMLAVELAGKKIRVNVICPGAIDTEISRKTERRGKRVAESGEKLEIPLTDGTKASPEQVAQLVWFLASDASSHITGSEIYIDGAESLVQ